jgi:hypothetical protein
MKWRKESRSWSEKASGLVCPSRRTCNPKRDVLNCQPLVYSGRVLSCCISQTISQEYAVGFILKKTKEILDIELALAFFYNLQK